MTVRGHIHEVFGSFQGEGTHLGRWQTFVRTGGCPLRCRYCDTPLALVRTEQATLRHLEEEIVATNPLPVEEVVEWVQRVDPAEDGWVSLTGGEPLEQPEFLAALCAALPDRKYYLETAGVHADAMRLLQPHVDTVALDLKLDSVAREGDRTDEHRAFLESARGSERVAKVIIGPQADLDEVETMARLVADEDSVIPLILQPETPRDGSAPTLPLDFLRRAYERTRRHLRDVRVIPQTHRFLSLP